MTDRPDSAEHTGIVIPGYRVERVLGAGGMAKVYLATQLSLKRQVALKIIYPNLVSHDSFKARFLKEGATAANLIHPNIIKVFDSGLHANHYYISMEYLSGGSLKDKIDKGLSIPYALSVMRQITDALRYAHEQGVIHRDIKSLNILLYEDGTPVLTDFGIAKAVSSNTVLTASGVAVGSPHYMSPEQFKGNKVTAQSDIYALGILFYEMLTGELPYAADDHFAVGYKHIYDPIPRLPEHLKNFQPLLDKMMAKEPEDRFADAKALLTELEQAESQYRAIFNSDTVSLRSAQVASQARPNIPSQRSRKTLTILAATVLLVAGASGIYYYQLQEPTGTPLGEEARSLLERARRLEDQGDYQASLELITRALVLAPRSRELLDFQHILLLQQAEFQRHQARIANLLQQLEEAQQAGDTERSLSLIRQGLELAPDNERFLALRRSIVAERFAALMEEARQAFTAGRYNESLARLDAARQLDADASELRQLRQQVVEAQELQQRRQQVQQALSRAREALNAQDYSASLARIDAGLEAVSDAPELLQLRQQVLEARDQARQRLLTEARAALEQQRYDESLARIEAAQELGGEDDELRQLRQKVVESQTQEQRRQQVRQALAQGREALAAGNFSTGLAHVDHGLELAPDDDALRQLRQQILDTQAQQRRQRQQQQLLVEAQTALEQQRYDESLAKLEAAARIDADHPELQTLRQQVLDAREQAQRRIRLQELFEQARLALQDGDHDESLAIVDRALQLAPDSIELRQLRQEALDQQSLARRQQQARQSLAQARAALETKDFSTGLAHIERGLELTPKDDALHRLRQQIIDAREQARLQAQADSALQQARAALQSGSLQDSLAHIDRGLELTPENDALQQLRQQVLQAQAQESRERQQQRRLRQQQQLLAEARSALEQQRYDESLAKLDAAQELG
ncbi:MAG: protein kinase, partial [Candidatus Competibacterales bacterium]|nr:protein kinase [Candidatus Competibacterales bacterium]